MADYLPLWRTRNTGSVTCPAFGHFEQVQCATRADFRWRKNAQYAMRAVWIEVGSPSGQIITRGEEGEKKAEVGVKSGVRECLPVKNVIKSWVTRWLRQYGTNKRAIYAHLCRHFWGRYCSGPYRVSDRFLEITTHCSRGWCGHGSCPVLLWSLLS